jgi:hypothetical protein
MMIVLKILKALGFRESLEDQASREERFYGRENGKVAEGEAKDRGRGIPAIPGMDPVKAGCRPNPTTED